MSTAMKYGQTFAPGKTCQFGFRSIIGTESIAERKVGADRGGIPAMVSSGPRRYDAGKEATMIELTERQMQALENPQVTPPRVVNPRTKETFVLLRVDEYEHLKEEEYDDSPWTREELQALAWERVKHEDWDEYDNLPEKP